MRHVLALPTAAARTRFLATRPLGGCRHVRREHPGWVIIWSALSNEYQARPLFRVPRGTVATGAIPEELTARMDEIRRAAPRSPRTSRI